jgi:hypothetical protein
MLRRAQRYQSPIHSKGWRQPFWLTVSSSLIPTYVSSLYGILRFGRFGLFQDNSTPSTMDAYLHDTYLSMWVPYIPPLSSSPSNPRSPRAAGLCLPLRCSFRHQLSVHPDCGVIHIWPGSMKSAPFSEYSQPMIVCFPLFPDRLPDHLRLL